MKVNTFVRCVTDSKGGPVTDKLRGNGQKKDRLETLIRKECARNKKYSNKTAMKANKRGKNLVHNQKRSSPPLGILLVTREKEQRVNRTVPHEEFLGCRVREKGTSGGKGQLGRDQVREGKIDRSRFKQMGPGPREMQE